MKLESAKEVRQFRKEACEAASSMMDQVAMRTGIDACYYESVQWLNAGDARTKGSWVGRMFTNWNPESRKLLATINRIPVLVQKVAASTFPDKIETDALPPDHDTGADAALRAQVIENVANSIVDPIRLTQVLRNANFRRCIFGTYGVGLSMRRTPSKVQGGGSQGFDCTIKAFEFEPTRLTLDPHNQSHALHDHEYVEYHEVWTAAKIRRELGIELDENRLKTVGELTPNQQSVNRLSNNRLFSQYREHSQSKGALVWQLHVRDDAGNFPTMFVGVETPDDEDMVLNFDDPSSPFGGNGLPLVLLHGHRRADTMWSLSDVSLLKDDQDRTNLLGTFFYRMLQKNAGYQWLTPSDAMPQGMSPEEFEHQFHNSAGGVIQYKAPTRDRPFSPPQLVKYPEPQSFVQNMIAALGGDMTRNIHRSEGNFGETKSHVPDASFQKAIEEADQVLGNRIREDMDAYETLLHTATCTVIRHAQEGSPNILGLLASKGFDAEDFAVLSQVDPVNLSGVQVRVRESAIRYRSHDARRQDLSTALDRQAIDPFSFRMSLARDLDRPLTETDRAMNQQAQKAAQRVIAGEEWTPKPLGIYGQVFIEAFQRALFDRRVRANPELEQRLVNAIMMQQQLMDAQAAQTQAATTPAQPGSPTQEQELPEEASLASLLTAIEVQSGGGAPGGPGQPQAA